MAALERAAARAAELTEPLHKADPNLGIVILVVDCSAPETHRLPIVATSNLDDAGRDHVASTYLRRIMTGHHATVSLSTAKRGGAR